jgi:Asp-tRNA(Asn)/Glu-tRNA(Gln) amidotransferase A subunit family amidase
MGIRIGWGVTLGVLAAVVGITPAAATGGGRGVEVQELTVDGLQHALRSHRVTCREVIRESLRRIAAFDDAGPALNALITINPRALDDARRDRRGPLRCVPILLKDNFDTADLPTTGGTLPLRDSRPPADAETVRRLRAAGAIVIGKSVLSDLALGAGTTFSSLAGQTRNPYDLTRTPGGSSGGTAAGVAAGFAIAGTGSDTVNSIRHPASANSLVGIRPTAGLVSRAGIIPLSSTQDAAGPIARNVPDVAALLDAMAGFDPKDPITARSIGRIPRHGYARGLRRQALRGARIGLLTPGFQPNPAVPEEQPVATVMGRAVADLRAAGATVVDVPWPGVTPEALGAALDVQRWETRPLLDGYLSSFAAPVGSLAELLATGQIPADYAPALQAALAADPNDPEYPRRLAGIADLRAEVLALMEEHRVDALAYPQQRRLVSKIGQNNVGRQGILASLTGLPTIDVPAGFSEPEPTAPIGVPIGLELTGRPFSEPRLLSLAYSFERAAPNRRPPPTTP